MVLSWEKRLARQHLREYTASTPYVNLHIILLPCQHDLGGTVVSRRDVSCHLGILNSREAEVADLKVAVLVDENIARFKVTVDDTGGMYIFQATLKRDMLARRPKQSYPRIYAPESDTGNIG